MFKTESSLGFLVARNAMTRGFLLINRLRSTKRAPEAAPGNSTPKNKHKSPAKDQRRESLDLLFARTVRVR
jgi:hypothetical protein